MPHKNYYNFYYVQMSKVKDSEYNDHSYCYRCEVVDGILENDYFYLWSKYHTKELAFKNDIDPKLFYLVK